MQLGPVWQEADNLEDIELWLECEAQRECTVKYENIIDSARERKDYASLNIIQKQILHWYPSLKDAIEEEQKAYLTKSSETKMDMNKYGPFLCTLPPQKLAVIVAHECTMNTLQKGKNGATLSSVAIMIGNAVEAEVNVQRLLQQKVEESHGVSKELNDDESDDDFVNADGQSHIASLSTDSESVEPDQESDHPKEIFNDWLYAGRDVIGRSRTGTGKTLAFGLPSLTRLTQLAEKNGLRDSNGRMRRGRPVSMIVLCPTRELARQVQDELSLVASPLGLFVDVFHGGVSYEGQVRISYCEHLSIFYSLESASHILFYSYYCYHSQGP